MKAEQRRIEEEARLERTAAKKDTVAEAMRENRTLEGFDMETTLQTNLLEQQLKVNREVFHVTKLTNVS